MTRTAHSMTPASERRNKNDRGSLLHLWTQITPLVVHNEPRSVSFGSTNDHENPDPTSHVLLPAQSRRIHKGRYLHKGVSKRFVLSFKIISYESGLRKWEVTQPWEVDRSLLKLIV